MPGKPFKVGVAQLIALVGTGELTGEVTVDQPYALVQHERTDYSHSQGGEAKYLETPIKEKHPSYLDAIADDLLLMGPRRAMIEAMEDLAGEVARRAPVEEGTLRASASPAVYSGGNRIYDRPPDEPRVEG